jgi:hypothetical protein
MAKRTCPPSPSPGPRAAHRGSPPHRHALAEVNAPPLAAQPGGTGLVVSLGPTDAFRRARGPVVSGASRRHRKAAWRRGTARRQRSLCRGITGEQRSLPCFFFQYSVKHRLITKLIARLRLIYETNLLNLISLLLVSEHPIFNLMVNTC